MKVFEVIGGGRKPVKRKKVLAPVPQRVYHRIPIYPDRPVDKRSF